jgi:hypothetical protein
MIHLRVVRGKSEFFRHKIYPRGSTAPKKGNLIYDGANSSPPAIRSLRFHLKQIKNAQSDDDVAFHKK